MFKIGVLVDSFRLSTKDGIDKAADVGAQGIQIYATQGEMSPSALDASARKELKDYINSRGLVVSALCGDMGGHGFQCANLADNKERIEKTKEIMILAKDLGTSVVTTHIGVIPEDESDPVRKTMEASLAELGKFGEEIGVSLAIETGPEIAVVLKSFIDNTGSSNVCVNLDPANFVMVTGQDPVEAVQILGQHIIHTHAKDGIKLAASDVDDTYGVDGQENAEGPFYLEKALGEGDVDFKNYIQALRDCGFDGFLTIEREVGDNPEKDIRLAVDFLKKLI